MESLAKPAIQAIGKIKLNLFQRDLKKPTLIGWKTYRIGVYQDKSGGGIEFQYITAEDCGGKMVHGPSLRNVLNVKVQILNKIPTYLTLRLVQHFGLFQRWAGLILQRIWNISIQQVF